MTAATTVGPPGTAPATGPAASKPRGPPIDDRGTVRHDEVRAIRWTVHGFAKVAGDVDVGSTDLDGTVVVGGSVLAEELSLRGGLEARGPLTVYGALRSHGSLGAGATVRAREARLDGTVRLAGDLVVETALRVRGDLRAPSLTCGELDLRGTAAIPGTVAATSLDAHLVADSSFGLIRCRRLRLRGPVPSVVRRVLGPEVTVRVERIEAESAFVESARVGFVRAKEVVLGRNAHVRDVEGRVVRAHASSRLGPESWTPPPFGLSR